SLVTRGHGKADTTVKRVSVIPIGKAHAKSKCRGHIVITGFPLHQLLPYFGSGCKTDIKAGWLTPHGLGQTGTKHIAANVPGIGSPFQILRPVLLKPVMLSGNGTGPLLE